MELLNTGIEWFTSLYLALPMWLQDTIWIVVKIVAIMLPLMLTVAYFTYFERKIIGSMQIRMGPTRVGFFGYSLWGLGQPIADAVKLMFKEIIIPTGANKYLFLTAPLLSLGPALAAWAVLPFSDGMVLAEINAALLYVLALTSVGVYGVIIAGWSSNSKYALLGTMRTGPDLTNIGARQPSESWHYAHLYNPQITSEGSIMPPYPYLFQKRKISGSPAADALELPADVAPEPGYEIVPTDRARALVAYLKSLDRTYDVE